MFTKEQEAYLAKLADAGLAEEADAIERNKQIEQDVINNAAIEVKKAELQAKADALVNDGLAEFISTLDNK